MWWRLTVYIGLFSACSSSSQMVREMDASSDESRASDASDSETGDAGGGLHLCQQNCGLPKDPDDPFDSRCPKEYPFLMADPLTQVECNIEGAHCYYCRGGVVTKSVQCAKATGKWVSQLVCAVP